MRLTWAPCSFGSGWIHVLHHGTFISSASQLGVQTDTRYATPAHNQPFELFRESRFSPELTCDLITGPKPPSSAHILHQCRCQQLVWVWRSRLCNAPLPFGGFSRRDPALVIGCDRWLFLKRLVV